MSRYEGPKNIGDRLPPLEFRTLEGRLHNLESYIGRPLILFLWATWWSCRNQLPVWQSIYEESIKPNTELLAVAIDLLGPDRVRPFVKDYDLTFPVLVDPEAALPQTLGTDVVPSCVFLDADQHIKWVRLSNFDIRKPRYREAVEIFGSRHAVADHDERAMLLFREGLSLYRDGQKTEAVELWAKASELAPDNRIIKEQLREARGLMAD